MQNLLQIGVQGLSRMIRAQSLLSVPWVKKDRHDVAMLTDGASIHADTLAEFRELDQESEEEGFPRTTPATKNIAWQILCQISQYRPRYYIVCPDDNGNISITARAHGNSVVILCKPDSRLACIVVHQSKGDQIHSGHAADDVAMAQFMVVAKSKLADLTNDGR